MSRFGAGGKSAQSIVPRKLLNKAERAAAKAVEERRGAKGEPAEVKRTPDIGAARCDNRARAGTPGCEAVGRKQRFTALLHYARLINAGADGQLQVREVRATRRT